ncbi:helix-turn-helix transcriptional regulator [Oceanospirillum sp. HFRX-1_2]
MNKLVVRSCWLDGKFYLCHAASYQNAFHSPPNGFITRAEAEKFARDKGFKISYDHLDPLQKPMAYNGHLIRSLRCDSQEKLQDVALALGTDRESIWDAEKGSSSPTMAMVLALSNHYKICPLLLQQPIKREFRRIFTGEHSGKRNHLIADALQTISKKENSDGRTTLPRY